MIQTKLFKSNRSQAVRLPKAVAYPERIKNVSIIAVGNSRLISPVEESWDVWFDEMSATDDFMIDREQPETQQREPLE